MRSPFTSSPGAADTVGEFPENDAPDALDLDAAEHDAFANSRAGIYIGRDEYDSRLDQHAASPRSLLLP